MHTTLDGFVAGPNGEMDWINLDADLFDLVGSFTNEADTALYGRVTYEMMNAYWPTAADQPGASKHDIEHGNWYNAADKIVLSKTMNGFDTGKTKFIGENIEATITALKNSGGSNILIFGSPSAVHTLMQYHLVDECWLFVNPVVLGQGIPMFAAGHRMSFKLEATRAFSCGVVALHYTLVH